MKNFNEKTVNILDLPDEILLIIFQKLKTIDVFYSLADVNRRFNRLALDSLYIRDVNMTIDSSDDQINPIGAEVFSRIGQKILHRIAHQVRKLTVEQHSMKEVLLSTNYPQLYSLSLSNFPLEVLDEYLRTQFILRDLLTKQITHLNIDINTTTAACWRTIAEIFALILSLCEGLIVLNFGDTFSTRKYAAPRFYVQLQNDISSSLIDLKINAEKIADCLHLLDDRLDSLSSLTLHISEITDPVREICGTKQLLQLKRFSLITFQYTTEYDDLIVPLLCRMGNLEELNLSLLVFRINSTFLDGIQLYDQFLISMPQLKKFTFNIKTMVCICNPEIILQSNEDVQNSFIRRGYEQVASYVHNNPMEIKRKCHIYSLPFDFDHFIYLDNSFQAGIFHKVRYLKMSDGHPFEYKFIKLISEDFPFLQFLYLYSERPQKDKEDSATLITFSYLTYLDLEDAHDDYVELFLLEKNTHLPRLSGIAIQYKSLTSITKNFTAHVKQFNFRTLKSLDLCEAFVRPESFHRYFPSL